MRPGEGHTRPKTVQNRKNRNQKMAKKFRKKIAYFPVSADISVDIPADISANIAANGSADISANIWADISADISADIGKSVIFYLDRLTFFWLRFFRFWFVFGPI